MLKKNKNTEVWLSIGVVSTFLLSFFFMIYFFIISIYAVIYKDSTNLVDWWRESYSSISGYLLISSVLYLVPLIAQYIFIKYKKNIEKSRRKYLTTQNILFTLLSISFIILFWVVWVKGVGIFYSESLGTGAIYSALLSYIEVLIIPITLSIVGLILASIQCFKEIQLKIKAHRF